MGEDVVRGKEFKQKLRVPMSDDEARKKGKLAGHLKKKVQEIKAKQKAAKDEFKEELTDAQGRLDAVLDDLDAGGDMREVKCVEEKHFKRNEVRVIRLDTEEVESTRPMSPEERQEMISVVNGGESRVTDHKPEKAKKRASRKKDDALEDGV